MENFDAAGMQDIAAYAPVRIALRGVVRTIYGLLLGVMAAAAVWATWGGDMKPTHPGDMPQWWTYLVGAALAFAAFCFVTGGVGRVISAFARDCYFRAGPQGISIRLPKNGWFGRFSIVEYRIDWSDIKQFVRFTRRINFIPVSTELRIERYAGKTVSIERHFFSASVKEVVQQLVNARAMAGR